MPLDAAARKNAIDKDGYQYALVGGSDSDYLWILSRTAAVDPMVKNLILTEAKRRGYDADKLLWVQQ